MKRWMAILPLCVLGLGLIPQSKAQCPAGVTNPLQVLSGTWAFHFKGSSFDVQNAVTFSTAKPALARVPTPNAQQISLSSIFVSAGMFTATSGTNSSGSPVGLLNVVDTSAGFALNAPQQMAPSSRAPGRGSAPHFVSSNEAQSGKFQIFADCSGGTLTFTSGTENVSFDFWFTNSFTEMYLVSDSDANVFYGVATRT